MTIIAVIIAFVIGLVVGRAWQAAADVKALESLIGKEPTSNWTRDRRLS